MIENLATDKYQKMAARIMNHAAYNAETLAKALQTHKKVITKLLAGQPITTELQLRLIKLFCKTCR